MTGLAKRITLTVVTLLVVLGVLGLGYVWATNASLRFVRTPQGVTGCVATSPHDSPPNPPFAPHAAPTGTFRLMQALGDPAVSGLPRWPGVFDSVPTAYDIDGDGDDEFIAQSNDTNVYVFDTRTGRALAVLPTNCPHGWKIDRVLNGVEAGVLNPGDPPSIVVTDHAAFVTAWRFVPSASNQDGFVFERSWERRANECFVDAGMDAKPTLSDVDGDGTVEILVQTEEIGFFAFNADGSTRWKQCWGGGNSEPVVHDLDDDGKLEAILASDGGFVAVLDASTGAPIWTFNARNHGIHPASIPVSPTVAELDGVAPREILFTARHAPKGDATLFSTFHMGLFAIHQNPQTYQGELVWFRQPEWAHPLSYTHLVVTDVDHDGAADIFGMDWNTIGHVPGNWEPLGPAHVFRLDAGGNDIWVREVDSWWSNKDLFLGDSDRDGNPDLLVNAAAEGLDGLARLSATTGEPLAFMPTWPWKLMRGATVHDLFHDGSTQVVYPAAPDEISPTHGALFVFEFDPS